MSEITIHRANPLIDPGLHIWGWEIAAYLFIGGLVAGLMILSGYHILRAQWDRGDAHGHYVTAPLLSLALLSAGMVALFLDLENKANVWRLYLTFQPASPMSWGSWILLLVYPALALSALLTLPDALPRLTRIAPALARVAALVCRRPSLVRLAGFANLALGVMLGLYTGLLLSAFNARPLWNSALLGAVFLVSGLSTGAAALYLLAHLTPRARRDEGAFSDAVVSALVHWLRPPAENAEGHRKLEHADNSFLTIELLLLALFLGGLLTSTAAHQHAAQLLLVGPWAAPFWVFVAMVGIQLPLTLQFLQTQGRIRATIIPAILVLCGGLALRIILVAAGQASAWTFAAH